MRKYILIVAVAVASFFAYSCNSGTIDREEVPVPAVKLVPLVLNSGHSVKTSLDSNGSSVNWTSGDHIAVIDNVEYSVVRDFEAKSVNGTSATFVGSVAEGTEKFYAVYPFSSVTTADESSIDAVLPSVQNPVSGTFAEEHNISVASGSKTSSVEAVDGVVFNNLCGLLKFTMPAELGEINEVKFIANRPIAGELIISKKTMSLLSAGDVNTVSMAGTFAANSTFYFVITPGEISGFSVSVTTSNGVILTKSSEKPIQISAGQIKNLGTIPMVVVNENLSVAHTTSEGILTGTEVKFTPSIDANTEFNAELINASGAVVRSLTSTATGSEFALPAESGKPYIPQGNYTFRYSYTIGSVNYTKSQKVTVPAPTFAVSISAETSYSRRQNISAASANSAYAGAPREVRNITVSGISSEVLTQMGVTYSASITEGETETALVANSTSPSTFATYTAKSVGSHTLTAICKFDGVMLECSASCVITGLPYTLNPAENDSTNPWMSLDNSNVTWNSGGLRLGYNWESWTAPNNARVAKTFYAPENINMVMSCDGKAVGTGSKSWLIDSRVNTTFAVNVSGKSLYSYNTTNGGEEQTFAFSNKQCVLTNADPVVTLSNSYSTATACSKVQSLVINYL